MMLALQYNSANSQMQSYRDSKVYIDPALIAGARGNNETGKRLAVIITFNENTFEHDYNAFIDKYGGSQFILKYKFSIIPGISGFINSDTLQELKAGSISMSIHQNVNLSIQLQLKSSVARPSTITPSQTTNWWRSIIGLNNATVSSLNGNGIKIGILDTGIGYNTSTGPAIHVDLSNKVVFNKTFAYGVPASDTFDEFGHGTHVAGIIAGSGAASSNGEYIGIAPGASLYNLKVLNSTGSGNEDDIIEAIQWSVDNHLNIINLSLGGGTADPTDPESMAVENATAHGLLVVMAEGNGGSEYFTGGSPAAAYGGIAVGAMNNQSQVSDFSSRGPSLGSVFEPDVVAPGENIISTLGANSFIEKYYGYAGLTISGTKGSDNDYVALDGTSMATPMVTGAAALILQKFYSDHLSPAFIKASLMASAKDLGYDACTQGMGLINVPGAISYLEKIQSNNSFASLLSVFPKKAPYAPYDLINFPGSSEEILLKVEYKTASVPQTVNFTYTGNLTGISITANPNPLVLTNASGEKIINFTIKSSFNATPGNYLIHILFKNASNAALLDQVLLTFKLQAPRLKIYLDSFNSIEDQYPWTFPDSRIAMDYYTMIKNFSESGVQVITYMDYWSSGYNSSQARSLLDYSWLQNFDAVIIPPLVTGLLPSEISALVQYHEHGGQIIILGARYEEFSYSSANALLNSLGMGVQFSPVNFEKLVGAETDNEFVDVPVTNLNSNNFLNQGLSNITWESGCELQISSSHVSIVASDVNGTGLIAMLPAVGETGSILVSGSESIFPVFFNDPASANNARFVKNLIGYYQKIWYPTIRINGYLSKNMVSNDAAISVFFQVFNKTSSLNYTLSDLSHVNCTLSNKTRIIENITVNTSGNWFGNDSVALSRIAFSSEPYIITVNFTLGGKIYQSTLAFSKFKVTGSTTTVTLSKTTPTRETTLYIHFSSTVVNETMMLITGIPLETFATRQPYSMHMNFTNENFVWMSLTNDMPAGQYFIEFMLINPNGSYPYPIVQRVSFTIVNYDPVIDTSQSTIDGYSFSSTEAANGGVYLVPVKTGQGISIIVAGADQESSVQNLSAYVVYYPTCTINDEVYLMPYGSDLTMQQLSYDSSTGAFSGSITLPSGAPITSTDYSGLLIVILRDNDGGYDMFFLLLDITQQFNILWVIIPLLISAPVVLVLVFFLVRRRRKYYGSQPRRQNSYGGRGPGYYGGVSGPGYYSSNAISRRSNKITNALNYCPYCGKPANISARFCPYCGNEIKFS